MVQESDARITESELIINRLFRTKQVTLDAIFINSIAHYSKVHFVICETALG
jgi:hypothetical protein